ETAEMQLKNMVGVDYDAPLTLGALPTVTAAQFEAMDLETDLAAAKGASYNLRAAEIKVEKFKKDTYDEVLKKLGQDERIFEVSQVKHALKSYEYERENTVRTFELNFRALYAKVRDSEQVLAAKRAALASEEKTYAAAAMRYRQGNLSANALADAKDALADAKDAVASAQRDLFTQYRSYGWAVKYGILNG
ncbi:MAG: TolC family protein, partial [Oscillibacter sp.]|nr:TolC family protein [Oscillibacter sp.]